MVSTRSALVSICILLGPFTSFAQTQPPKAPATPAVRTFDLPSAIQQGVKVSPELRAAESKSRQSDSKAWQYKAEVFPEISARATTERRQNSGAMSAAVASKLDPYDTYLAAIDLKQPIFSGMSLISGWKYANSLEITLKQELFQSQQTVVKNLIFAFYDFAAANDYYRSAMANNTTLQNYSTTMGRYAKIGRGREMDRLQASVNASISEVDVQNAEQAQREAELRFKTLLGLSATEPVGAKFEFQVQSLDPITLEQALDIALKNNPKILVLQKNVEQRDYLNDVEIATDRPSLDFVATYGSNALEREDMFGSRSDFYSYGLSLKIPLFSGFSSISKKRDLREQLYQTEKTFEIEKRNLREQLKNALANVDKLSKQYKNLQEVAGRSQRALDLVMRGFGQGTTTSQDVVNFQKARYEIDHVMIDSQYAYLKSVAELRELLGTDLLRVYGGMGGRQ